MSTRNNPAIPKNDPARMTRRTKRFLSGPVDGQLARIHHDVFISSREFHEIHEQLHIVLAIFANVFLPAVSPPLDNFQSISRFLVSECFLSQVIEFDAMP